MTRLKHLFLMTFTLFSFASQNEVKALPIIVRNDLATTDGDTRFHTAPFNNAEASRYMQIYSASQFSTLSAPASITQITLRADQASAFTKDFSSVDIYLSTSRHSVSELSSIFSENIGADNTLVRSGPLTIASSSTLTAGTARVFDVSIPLSTPFTYDPSAGNLVLEIRNFSGGESGFLDGFRDPTATITRLVFRDGSATATNGIVQSGGFVTEFTFATVPEPGSVVLCGVGALAIAGCGWRRRKRSA